MRHEDVCLRPLEKFAVIFNQLNVDYSPAVKRHIRESTSRNNTTLARGDETHQLQRNSEAVSHYWRRWVSTEERDQIRSIAEPVASDFYSDESWKLEDPQKL